MWEELLALNYLFIVSNMKIMWIVISENLMLKYTLCRPVSWVVSYKFTVIHNDKSLQKLCFTSTWIITDIRKYIFSFLLNRVFVAANKPNAKKQN